MAKAIKLSDTEQVTAHIQNLDKTIVPAIEKLRQLILGTDKEIGERIKWNNPSFYYTGEMNPFDPKEYKREIVVFNLFKNTIMFVLPGGGRLNDNSGLLQGDYKEGRRVIVFKDLEDINAKKKLLQHIITEWIKTVDK